MRLPEVERGDSLRIRALIRTISAVYGARLPDAARVAFYHKGFVGNALGAWTHTVMSGPSDWTIGERELMAATVARWSASTFCIGAHRAVAIRGGVDRAVANACLIDYRSAPIPEAPKRLVSPFASITPVLSSLGGQ